MEHTLDKLRETLQVREEWLAWKGLPRDHTMGDTNGERKAFINWVKGKYESTDLQLDLQKKDLEQGGTKKQKEGKRSRWCRELQRRAGSKVLWELISFTGKFCPELLSRQLEQDPHEKDEPSAEDQTLHQRLLQARLMWRTAARADRKRQHSGAASLTPSEREALRGFDDDSLRNLVNNLTARTGNGRLRGSDGTFVDIGGNDSRSLTRRALDSYEPPTITDIAHIAGIDVDALRRLR